MELKDVTKNLRSQTHYRLEQKFKRMMRTNPRYRNLDKENQKLIGYLKPLSKELDSVIRQHAKKMSIFS